ncbi:hypothetical protein Fmac_026540 [Flemingia macrophylla]|uniref:Uncharacterized protein n=1 Tax=Flemingia macrophylla TaxID=520843 RepID=A0ABD1LFA6_9FABA
MKKMKGVVSVESPPYSVYEDQRARLRHQSLLQDFEDLQEETNAMRMKLLAAKQKKLILSAEVRFLRQRYKYLIQNPSPKPKPKLDISHRQKLKVQATHIPKGKKYNRNESTLRPPMASHLISKERISNGVEPTVEKTVPIFDLNQNASSVSKMDPSLLNCAPVPDLNHKDGIHGGKEAAKKRITPFFDLNEISREEEELLANIEPMREEPRRIVPRGVNEEQYSDVKLSVCRNVGNGSNRTVKRKISWQDQVALRV